MDPVTLVVGALVAGAAAGAANVASTAVVDAYRGLKSLILGRLRDGGLTDDYGLELIDSASGQLTTRELLARELNRVGVDDPTVEAAQLLMDLLEQQKGKFVVDASQAKGLIVGDNAVQHNTFN